MSYIDTAEVEHFVDNSLLYKGFVQQSLKQIRDFQDKDLTHRTVRLATQYLYYRNLNKLIDPTFFAGSVDFMVEERDGKKVFHIIEADGVSTREFSVLPKLVWQMAHDSILETMTFVDCNHPLVLIGHPDKDKTYYEKFYLADNFRRNILMSGWSRCDIVGVGEVTKREYFKHPVILIGSYDEVAPRLSMGKSRVYFDRNPIDVIVGDQCIAFDEDMYQSLPFLKLKTIIVNMLYQVTDCKSLTHGAVDTIAEKLSMFNVEPTKWWRAWSKDELKEKIKLALKAAGEVVIKPHAGRNGIGLELISSNSEIDTKINKSLRAAAKRSEGGAPFPYTICRRIEGKPVVWRGKKHFFDVRVFLGRSGSRVLPLGIMIRIGKDIADKKTGAKKFLVSIDNGNDYVLDRGLGLNSESLAITEMDEMDVVDMLTASAVLMTHIGNNHQLCLTMA